jgi:hypothetical protein
MAWETVAKCDVCRVVKGESNHWLLVQSHLKNGKPVMFQGVHCFDIMYWDEKLSHVDSVQVVCGESCLHKLLQPFLDARSTIPATNPNHNPTDERTTDEGTDTNTLRVPYPNPDSRDTGGGMC